MDVTSAKACNRRFAESLVSSMCNKIDLHLTSMIQVIGNKRIQQEHADAWVDQLYTMLRPSIVTHRDQMQGRTRNINMILMDSHGTNYRLYAFKVSISRRTLEAQLTYLPMLIKHHVVMRMFNREYWNMEDATLEIGDFTGMITNGLALAGSYGITPATMEIPLPFKSGLCLGGICHTVVSNHHTMTVKDKVGYRLKIGGNVNDFTEFEYDDPRVNVVTTYLDFDSLIPSQEVLRSRFENINARHFDDFREIVFDVFCEHTHREPPPALTKLTETKTWTYCQRPTNRAAMAPMLVPPVQTFADFRPRMAETLCVFR